MNRKDHPVTISNQPETLAVFTDLKNRSGRNYIHLKAAFEKIVQDRLLVTGWLLLVFSFTFFACSQLFNLGETASAFFLLHFAAALSYYFVLFFSKSLKVEAHRIHYQMIKLVMFLISAYSLNRELPIFEISTTWLSVLLVVSCAGFLAATFYKLFPNPVRMGLLFLFGISFTLFTYLSICLFPYYGISLFVIFALAISVHTFIPLLISIYSIVLVRQLAKSRRASWMAFFSGVAASLIACVIFTLLWNSSVKKINRTYSSALTYASDDLPPWVRVAQVINKSQLSEMVLKSDLVYKTDPFADGFFFSMPSRGFGEEQRVHDPLVVIADFFTGRLELPEDDRIKILESNHKARHQALERLWTGADLSTTGMTTSVRIWPSYRMAYTEKLITVSKEKSRDWNRQGEAIYTFHMPEGSVVSALSLWINGHEEKGILTAKGKAETAYRTIVGYERRDPSVVHWQEGNTVTVRVFPVLSDSSRMFRVGFTSPLSKEDDHLVYEDIQMEGPDASSANETVNMEVEGSTPDLSSSFTKTGKRWQRSGSYQPGWRLALPDPGFEQKEGFSFNGSRYSVQPLQSRMVPASFNEIYLDINHSWTTEECDEVWNLVKGKNVIVWNEGKTRLTEANHQSIMEELREQRFSLFPFHIIKDREHALVVSKSDTYSPSVADLDGTPFINSLRVSATSNQQRIRIFELGSESTPYLRTLKEYRLFDEASGSVALLKEQLVRSEWPVDEEADDKVVIHAAGMMIRKDADSLAVKGSAPDHLMRLFAYNRIMQQLGAGGFTHTAKEEGLTDVAIEAGIVSPVSSLVVLETKADYDRFGIENKEGGLKNATLKGSGAVPEPHEWAIIILVLVISLVFLHKWKSI
jgi:XrtN system VIT domain protein